MTTLRLLPDTDSPLDHATALAAFGDMLDGRVPDAEAAAFLTGLTVREETAIEIAAAAQALRERMIPVQAPANAIDVCGTGGDGSHSLNVSTAVAIVVAACGIPVAKHGNRAASSSAGAADTLEALGLDLDRASAIAEDTLGTIGIAFLFAQKHHPALGRLAPVRRAIGRRTIFNLIGPIANPARVRRQLIGVARPDFLPTYATALRLIGVDSAMIVAGDEPLDELSVCAPSTAIRIGACGDRTERITPADAGLPTYGLDDLRGGDPAYNAAALTALLVGAPGAYRDAVLLNAAGALIVADAVSDWTDGVALAADAIDSGRAATLLSQWIAA
ncbi:anthranilate phosphoribosyltransferase [Sphingomonas prati]|uniref:Anthranilate phosphoribosyltransferase n=1 Tax=Sphingomonas prati TaxID=1843237 RepID=A0A7W9F245_9SPHN|nr:anthranilate phosphoribosyltransferase [Sphingomonas prati]MBB5729993.1 anthranilate phosphoribosyltransferase [Sphingomonas prati]GGE90584.1 anthranilate phosphoribosyltransferase [Sphingomonas prati]